ncbi:MAG: hypothetical protein JNK30_17230 [Phenylobacterium sp.]|uniref:hypothetical protein n=1 Tax=Phenylobacterium sp. TaxID=1871053 RepID=UPI001A568B06|nr:hypothetical protein [Phenylobacterium sp.]MBL8773127.1 hypothetical protein [Phenylobacterium sp.]
MAANRRTGPITEYVRFDGFVLAVNHPPEPARVRGRRRLKAGRGDLDYGVRSGLAFAVLTAPRVNAMAWFALAVAAPAALLALAAAATRDGLASLAGLTAAALLAPALLLALPNLERRPHRPRAAADPRLIRAFCLTVGMACGLLFVVVLGAPFSGEAVAVGLAMAAAPLAVAVAADLWARTFRPIGARTPPVEVGRDWLAEWAETERAQAPEPEPAVAEVIRFPTPPPRRAPAAPPAWTAPRRRRAAARR